MASTYSTLADLLLGDLPVPAYVDSQKYVDDAANEIDSYIGYSYQTPIDMTDDGPVARPARLLIKRIASHLSSGRLLLAIAVASESAQLHAYGKSLVDEAVAALNQIATGNIPLPGAVPIGGADTVNPTGPLISNIDQFSTVEAFYQRMAVGPLESETVWRFPGG